MIHSATTTLITHAEPISTVLANSPGWPTRMTHGKWVNTCVPAPIPMAYARVIHAPCETKSRRLTASMPSTIDANIAVPAMSRST
jgi:hypothetical protein